MNEIVKIKDDRGQELQITPDDVRNVICPSANDKEIAIFLELCRAQNLNPFINDAYLVKYGSAPATIITGKEVFTKRAAKNKSYKGFEAGITVQRGNSIERREGSAVFAGEKLLGEVSKDENASAEAEDTEEDMNCIYQPNGQSYLVWFDGNTCHPLAHPDEVTAINMMHKQCTGRDIPVFALGQETAPWANRFEAAVGRTF